MKTIATPSRELTASGSALSLWASPPRGTPAHHPLSILSRQSADMGYEFVPILSAVVRVAAYGSAAETAVAAS